MYYHEGVYLWGVYIFARGGCPVFLYTGRPILYYGADASPTYAWRVQAMDEDLVFMIVKIGIPDNVNIILGQSHFIKTVEDISEVVTGSVPAAKFGLAFCEASGDCLIRTDGNDNELKTMAADHAGRIGAGHSFILVLRDCYPINILNAIKNLQEVCTIYCATANPLEVIIAESGQGRGIMGVIDGEKPRGIEGPDDVAGRISMLRKFGYKRG